MFPPGPAVSARPDQFSAVLLMKVKRLINARTAGRDVPLTLFPSPPVMSAHTSPTRPPSDGNSTEIQETFDTLKQKYDRLVRKSKKRRRNPSDPTVEERARGIRKVASLYANISTLAAVALAQEEGGDSDDDETMAEEEKRRQKIE
jgi:hypothetical protein